jgi:hypothetical protein
MNRLRHVFLIVMLLMAFTACQKDEDMKEVSQSLKIDSAKSASLIPTPGTSLALAGTLKINIGDSTYTFDAAKDSIAFVNVYMDSKKYFGITAINKLHTMSFGISSPGYAAANTTGPIAGSQFLFNTTANKANIQYTLSQNAGLDPGKINLTKYSQDSVLAKGTFVTYLTKDTKPNSTFIKAEGSFELKRK